MKNLLIRSGIMIVMFSCVYGWHELLHGGHPFYGGMLGGCAFVLGELLIQRTEG